MSTEFSFTLYARPGDRGTDELRHIAEEAFQAVDDLEARISNWKPDSRVTYINNHAAEGPVRASPDVLELIAFSQKVNHETEGVFDPTVGPLIKLWGFYRKQGRIPSHPEISAALEKVGIDKIEVNDGEGTVGFAKPGMLLDFGGIGKGLALDEAADVIKRHGVTVAYLNAGTSSVLAMGAPPGREGWTVKVRHPYRENDSIAEFVIRDESLSTSGCYGKQLEAEGRTLCNILDPRTGMPIEGMLSASVIGKTGMETDALSTAFMVLGPEGIIRYCRSHPDVRAIVVGDPGAGEPKAEYVNVSADQGGVRP
jgi:thiamine biosynthesis lipoprotein